MSESASARPKILVAHQWKAERGLYGADRVILRILRELSAIADLIVVIESQGEFADAARKLGCRVEVREMGVLRRQQMTALGLPKLVFATLRGALGLVGLIQRERVAMVLTSTAPVIASAIAAKLTRRPHLWFVQEMLWGKNGALAPLIKALSNQIVCVSNAAAESIDSRGTKNPKIAVLYPGVDARRFDSPDQMEARKNLAGGREVLIAHVARIHPWKGQGYFLEALSELKKRGLDGFRAVIAGDVYPGYENVRDALVEKVKELGLGNVVSFLGHRDDADAIFNAADIVVSPTTLPEPFGLVVVEAMAARRPVIATAVGGPAEIIENGVSGILIPTENPNVFADRLEELISDRGLCERLGSAARQRVERAFRAENFDREIRRRCEALLRGSKIS